MRLGIRKGLVGLALVAACDQDAITENRQVRLTVEMQPGNTFVSGEPIVEQSAVCVEIAGLEEHDDVEAAEAAACYEELVVGPATRDEDGCLALTSPGIVELRFDRRPCAVDAEPGDDVLAFEVVGFEDVVAGFEPARQYVLEVYGLPLTVEAPSQWPAGVKIDPGEPIRVLDDVESVSAHVLDSSTRTTVRTTDATAFGTAIAGAPQLPPPDGPVLYVPVSASDGDAFHVTVDLPAGSLDVGDVYVVDHSEITSIEAYPEVVRFGDGDELLLVSAYGVARDAQGRVLRGAKLDWEQLDGDGVLSTDPLSTASPSEPSGSVGLREICDSARAGETRKATLRATLDDLETTVEVQWQCQDGHTDGCGCHSHGQPVPAGLIFVVVACVRRRRQYCQ